MDINIRLSDASIMSAIQQIEEYRNTLESKAKEVCDRLAAIGVNIVSAKLMSTPYAGYKDISVYTISGENFCTIHAESISDDPSKPGCLWFVEFGAGIYHATGQYANQVGAVPHGSYGKHQGGNKYGWIYKGVAGDGDATEIRPGYYRTYGNDPADAFPAAVEELKQQVTEIVREVFGIDD